MKILQTGYTTRMWGSLRVQGDYITFSYLLEDILKEMGHTVERRKVVIGENLSDYDFAFCGVAPLSSMTSVKVPETHYVMDRMEYNHVIYADDWSFCGFGKSVIGALKDWGRYIDYKRFPYEPAVLEDTRRSMDLMVNCFDRHTNTKVLAPMFPWGDHSFLMRGNYSADLVTVDPSGWIGYPDINIPSFKDKKKRWVMAALSDHSNWVRKQKLSLPVVYVGNKRMGDGIVLSEASTVQLFAENYGVLAAGYPSAGSGWWRTRYLNAAWAESIVYTDPLDQEIMGEAYQNSSRYFENLSESEYGLQLGSQQAWLYANISTREEVRDTLSDLLRSVQ